MKNFGIMETSIAKVHQAFLDKSLTVKELISFYLKRIESYDKNLLSIILINPNALDEAEKLDNKLKKTGKLTGLLYGIPVMLKDNVDTDNMITTAGSKTLENHHPTKNAFIVKRLLEEEAIILAKTNLHEFAIWGETVSSILGYSVNPYDFTRSPGGSSGGTAASIAANFGIIGIGTDTINSIRSPASACSLVGIRPTIGLVSRSGIVPYSLTQDTSGPICRTVEDAVRTLDVIKGYDPEDAITAKSVKNSPISYIDFLKKDGLNNKRIGVLKSFFGKAEIHQPVNNVMVDALEYLKKGGAILVDMEENIDSDHIVNNVSVHLDDFKTHLDGYLKDLPENALVHSLQDVLNSGLYHPGVGENIKSALKLAIGTPEYNKKLVRQEELRIKILKIMADNNLDAMVYPHQQQLVCKIGGSQKQRNGALCSATGFPSIAVPAGFAKNESLPIGVPVGMEIMGRPFSEKILIEIAYSFEHLSQFRKIPVL